MLSRKTLYPLKRKNESATLIIYAFFFLLLFSCEQPKNPLEKTNTEQAYSIPDSIDSEKVIAIYKEDIAHTILVYHTREKKGARKITYRSGFPVFVDSLLAISFNEFRSCKYTTTYLVCDTGVTSVYDLKVIHPSSNSQGQTPGKEPIIISYRRIDK